MLLVWLVVKRAKLACWVGVGQMVGLRLVVTDPKSFTGWVQRMQVGVFLGIVLSLKVSTQRCLHTGWVCSLQRHTQ